MAHTIGIQFNWTPENANTDIRSSQLKRISPPARLEADHLEVSFIDGKIEIGTQGFDRIIRQLHLSLPKSDYSNIYCYLTYDHPYDPDGESPHRVTVTELTDRKDMATNFVEHEPDFAARLRADGRYLNYNRLFQEALLVTGTGPLSVSLEAYFEREPGQAAVVFVSCMVE